MLRDVRGHCGGAAAFAAAPPVAAVTRSCGLQCRFVKLNMHFIMPVCKRLVSPVRARELCLQHTIQV